mgnify:CR=1 FL=1
MRTFARWAHGLAACVALLVGCGEADTTLADNEQASNGTEETLPAPNGGGGGENTSTTSPDAPAPEAPQSPAPLREDLGEGDGRDVVALGDSYMRLPNLFQGPGNEGVDVSLAKAGKKYRTRAYTGANVFPPKPVAVKNGVIPNQFKSARAEDPNIKTVIVSGGANDIDDSDGCNGAATAAELSDKCKQELDSINDAIDAFLAEMAQAGVQDVIWVGYGPTPTSGNKVVEGAIDYLRTTRKARCTTNNAAIGLRCHYIDNFAAQIPTRDGFHPTSAGYDAIANAVLARMKEEGVRR